MSENDIERLTFLQYNRHMKAYQLRRLDREYEIHLSAWANRSVNSEKKVGKDKAEPVYKDFNKFFNYLEREKRLLGTADKLNGANKHLLKIHKRKKEFEKNKSDE